MSRKHYGRIENGLVPNLTLVDLNRIASVLGLSPSVRVYPSGIPVRDVAHTTRLQGFLTAMSPPLTHRVEVPLPPQGDRPD